MPCTDCARAQCCSEIEFCMMQPECGCFLECLPEQPAAVCQKMCESASGVAAVMVCLGMSCAAECEA